MPRLSGHRGGRGEFSGSGSGLPRGPRQPRADSDSGRRFEQEHVQLPGAPDRADSEYRSARQHDHPPRGGRRSPSRRSSSSMAWRGWCEPDKRERWRLPPVFSFIGAEPRTDWLPRRSSGTPKVSSGRERLWRSRLTGPPRGRHFCWRPAGPASSPPEMSAPVRPNASPRRSAKAQCRSSSCTSI